ncbi:MAG: hypothetical protein ACYCO9_22600 [Streptosporangiaceae bacterium]
MGGTRTPAVRHRTGIGEPITSGLGPFTTLRLRTRPDGAVERWESRRYRKHLSPGRAAGSTWWAPGDRDWWIGILFGVGSALFGLGVLPAYARAAGTRPDAATFFAGSVFFTAAAFLRYRESVDAAPVPGCHRRKVFVLLPGQIDWLSAGIQLVGTVAFNVSTAVAIWAQAGPEQAGRHLWRPDLIGSICFLAASWLAWSEVSHGWASWRPGMLAWWITAVNLLGSAAFGVSAVASYLRPGTTDPLSASSISLGTFIGAACFLAGAVLLLYERTEPVAARADRASGGEPQGHAASR